MAEKWYDGLYGPKDDALERGLELLESLRGALPIERASAIDEAKELLRRAATIYKKAQEENEIKS